VRYVWNPTSYDRDRLAEVSANLKTMAAVMRETAHTAAQKGVQDRLMSGNVHDALKSSLFAIEGGRLLRLENPTGQQGGMFGLEPVAVPARKQTRRQRPWACGWSL
jgi:hypothetical protein